MELLNPIPMPGLAFRQFDQQGDLDCVVILRGTFEHVQDGVARWHDEQMPLQWQDVYEGDPHETPLLYQGDLVPEKTGTDVTFLGASHAPGGPQRNWRCGIEIGSINKMLHVSGTRHWRPVVRPARWPFRRQDEFAGWQLGEAQPADTVAMDWRFSAGGRDEPEAEPDSCNRIGCGRIGPPESWQNRSVPAPRIASRPYPTPDDAPAGFGPIPPFWQQRARYAGTYDDAWQANRHPLLPEDFDPRFWQCAPEDQIARPFLRGDEAYTLTHLHPDHPLAHGRLPALSLAVRIDEGAPMPLELDGVQFDWRDEALIMLTWRTRFPLPEAQGVKLHLTWGWLNRAVAA